MLACPIKSSSNIDFHTIFLDRGRMRSNNSGGNRNYNRFQQSRHQQHQYQLQQEQNVDPWEAETSSSMQQPFFMLNQQMNSFHQQIPKTVYTVHCGECRPKDEGVRVKISGKVVKRPRTGRFLEIKDMKGCTQLVKIS